MRVVCEKKLDNVMMFYGMMWCVTGQGAGHHQLWRSVSALQVSSVSGLPVVWWQVAGSDRCAGDAAVGGYWEVLRSAQPPLSFWSHPSCGRVCLHCRSTNHIVVTCTNVNWHVALYILDWMIIMRVAFSTMILCAHLSDSEEKHLWLFDWNILNKTSIWSFCCQKYFVRLNC